MNIDKIARVTAAVAIDPSRGHYTTQRLDDPKNSQTALIIVVYVEPVDFVASGLLAGKQLATTLEIRYLLYKPRNSGAETEIWATGTWYNLYLRGHRKVPAWADPKDCVWIWEAADRLSDSLVAELNLTHRLQVYLSNHDVSIDTDDDSK